MDKENAEAEMKRKEEAVQVPELFGMIHLQVEFFSPTVFSTEKNSWEVFLLGGGGSSI